MLQSPVTRTAPRSQRVRALDHECPMCGVGPGESCIDQRLLATGRRMPNATPHAQRIALVRREPIRATDLRV